MILAAGADHIPFREDTVLHKIHILDRAKSLFRVVIVTFDVSDTQKRYAGKRRAFPDGAEILPIDKDAILVNQLGRCGNTGEIDGRFVVTAEFVSGITRHNQLKGSGVFPCAGRIVTVTLRGRLSCKPRNVTDNLVVDFHQNLISCFFLSKIRFTMV